ncbi:MAG: phosphoadenosine phosphosulfate reductase [Gammaproteobacteria bacterium]|nr:MAG: phosphoadenosine phosphosulfate reductase [Gammaproteobacteria bacterium]
MNDDALEQAVRARLDDTRRILDRALAEHARVVFANSLGAEDMVLTDLLFRHYPQVDMFSLDTGRLPEETYALMDRVEAHYGRRIPLYFPDTAQVEAFVREHGVNAFYRSVELRKACCRIRKVEPLKRALAGYDAWITGQRRAQSITRADLQAIEHDPVHGMIKVNPLVDWSEKEVWHYIRSREVPYNVLHDRFYPSIGCAPCTRAITPGEDIRAGRWWWENPETKECGLHPGRRGAPGAAGPQRSST